MTLLVERLGPSGDGVAEGRILVPLSLPGERVEGEIVQGRIAAPRIVTPSPERVRPPCRHFRSCGGCSLQHGSDELVTDWKVGLVRSALAAHGLRAPVRNVHTSPPGSRRRAVFSGRRGKSGAIVGFHRRASDVIVEVADCQILRPEILALLPAMRRMTMLGATRKSEVSMTVTLSHAGADIAVKNAREIDARIVSDLAEVAEEHGIARVSWNGEAAVLRDPPVAEFDGIAVRFPPGAFLQATQDGEIALERVAGEITGGARRIVDLFAGCGTFALPLARGAEVLAVESSAEALGALDEGWRNARGLKSVRTEVRDLFRRPLVPQELDRFDAAVLDPPRAGAAAQVAEIASSGLQRVAMMSCNPLSFARDAKTLTDAGFSIDFIDVVDQFRWSAHVELAAQMTRGHIGTKTG